MNHPMQPVTITTRRLWHYTRQQDRHRLLAALGQTEPTDEPIPLSRICQAAGLDVALAATELLPEHGALWATYGDWCVSALARRIQAMDDPPAWLRTNLATASTRPTPRLRAWWCAYEPSWTAPGDALRGHPRGEISAAIWSRQTEAFITLCDTGSHA